MKPLSYNNTNYNKTQYANTQNTNYKKSFYTHSSSNKTLDPSQEIEHVNNKNQMPGIRRIQSDINIKSSKINSNNSIHQKVSNTTDAESKDQNFIYISSNKRFLLLFYNILKKHNLPMILPDKSVLNETSNEVTLFMTWHVNEYYMRELTVPQFYKDIITTFLQNDTQRFIVFPVILYNPRSIIHPEYTTHAIYNFSHIIILIYDKKYKYLERFDSGNSLYEYDSHILDTNIVNTFKNMFNVEVKGINTPWMICKSGGIQMYQENEIYNTCIQPVFGVNIGFCSIYVLWYIEKRLQNVNDKPCDIIFNFYNHLYKNNETDSNFYNNSNNKIQKNIPLTTFIVEYTRKLLYNYEKNIDYNKSLLELFQKFY